jgi:hypothetical protein
MTVRAAWDNPQKTIMRWTFEGAWTWDEYYKLRVSTNQQIAAEQHTVDLIVDLSTSKALPSGILTHGKNAVSVTPKNIGITVLVGANPVLNAFYKMFSSLYGTLIRSKKLDMVMVTTLDAAYKLLKEQGASGLDAHHK